MAFACNNIIFVIVVIKIVFGRTSVHVYVKFVILLCSIYLKLICYWTCDILYRHICNNTVLQFPISNICNNTCVTFPYMFDTCNNYYMCYISPFKAFVLKLELHYLFSMTFIITLELDSLLYIWDIYHYTCVTSISYCGICKHTCVIYHLFWIFVIKLGSLVSHICNICN